MNSNDRFITINGDIFKAFIISSASALERKKDEITLVVIKGKAGEIIGLDEGIWVSAKNGKLKSKNDVFVMSEAVFKIFATNP